VILASQKVWVVAASQVATAIAGAAIVPAVSGIALGMVRQAGFPRQNGRNQAFNHAGNVAGAALSGLLGWRFGLPAVFWLAAAFGALSIGSVLRIRPESIDDVAARGLEGSVASNASGFKVLLQNKPLLVLAAALACFHLGNGAMLPLYGLAMVSNKQGDPASLVDITIVVAQAVMIAVSLVAMRMAEKQGYWLRYGARQRRTGRGDDRARPGRIAQPRDRRVDSAGPRLSADVPHPRQLRHRLRGAVGALSPDSKACLCSR